MIKHEEYMRELQKDVEVPEKVWDRFEETLDNIEDLAARREEDYMEMKKKKIGRTWIKAAVVAGVVTAGGSVFCYNNPAIASKIPVIGNIFEQVEDDVTYAGNYAKKEVLNDKKNMEGKVDKKQTQEGIYTAKSQGITITASEVYCDGYSVYLTAKVESEKGGFENIPEYYTRRFGGKTSKAISTSGTWEVNDFGKETFPSNIDFEGKTVDDHTFIGMIKLDLKQHLEEDGILKLNLSELWYEDARGTESIESANRIVGEWKLTVPYSVDKGACKEVVVNKINKEGYGIQKVFVSPYQVIVFSEVPYTTLSTDTYTKEEFESAWGEKNKELIAQGEEPVTYEDILNEKQYAYSEVVVYNQDQEALEFQHGDATKTVFAVQGKSLSNLHVYMGDESQEMELIKAENKQEAKKKSILDVEVNSK